MQPIFTKIANAWRDRPVVLVKMLSFASIGVVNVIIDVIIFTILVQFLHLHLIAANILSWLVAVTGSYMMNSKITFGRETGGLLSVRRYLRFAGSGILGVAISTAVLLALSNYINIPTAKLASILAGFGVNFCMSHFVVFRAYPSAPSNKHDIV
jgi:putative flippase GtrA